jgi:hypothetical protein
VIVDHTHPQVVEAIRARCPEIDALVSYVRRIAAMTADLDGHLPDAWIVTTQISGLPALASGRSTGPDIVAHRAVAAAEAVLGEFAVQLADVGAAIGEALV